MSSTKVADGVTASGRLTGSTAVITGASRGIGLAIAEAFVTCEARVVMIARGEAALQAHSRRLGPRAIPLACDVTSDNAVRAMAARVIEQFDGPPDILVNNAGTFTLARIESVDPASFVAELDTNLAAPFRLVHAFLPGMRARQRGHIVTIGSIGDRTIFPENASYAASKFGARALHEVLRLETRGSGVRASLVSPAQVDTPMWDPIDPDHRPSFTPRSEMLRAGAVADAVVYVVTQPPDVNVDELRLSHS